jgi:hypothetical protein
MRVIQKNILDLSNRTMLQSYQNRVSVAENGVLAV